MEMQHKLVSSNIGT